MPTFFGDHMVLQSNHQCGVRSFLSGWAAPHEAVTVTIAGKAKQAYVTAADAQGNWSLQLDPPGPGVSVGAEEVVITVRGGGGGDPVVARNVVFGDVWLCAGGAAMHWSGEAPLPPLPPGIRLYSMPEGPAAASAAAAGPGWLRSDVAADNQALAASSRLCLLSAAAFLRELPSPATRKIGLIVSAVAQDEDIRAWMPSALAAAACAKSSDGDVARPLDAAGRRYGSLIAPLSMTSVRTVLWSLSPPSLPPSGGSAEYSCLLRTAINGWRDGMQNGDYSFVFLQSSILPGNRTAEQTASMALAEFSALPLPSAVLSNRTTAAARGARFAGPRFRGGPNPYNDHLDVDTTGMAAQADLLAAFPARSADWAAAIARRLSLAILHVGFALQPPSLYAGPRPTGGALSGDGSGFSLRFSPASVLPGRLLLKEAAGCRGCCARTVSVDVRLCKGVEPSNLTDCVDAVNVTVAADGTSIAGTAASPLSGRRTAVLMSRLPTAQGCLLVSSASNLSVATSAVVLDAAFQDGHPAAAAADPVRPRPARRNATAPGPFGTPPLGWNAWNAFHCDVSERLIVAMADAMVATGMRDAGYSYLNLDDCWMVDRGPDGSITPDPVRFPSGIRALADYVHSRGLRFGIYQAPAATTPQGRPGLLGHEAQDVATFCEWGVDYLKLDSKGSTRKGWEKVRAAIDACTTRRGRPMFLQVAFCRSVAGCTGWMDALANSWRTSQDAQATWQSVMSNVDATEPLWPLAGPTGPIGGHWNDADLLEVGNVGLAPEEVRSQIALWAFMNVPILLSCDMRKLQATGGQALVGLLVNERVLALNQDPLGYQGRRLRAPPPPPPASHDVVVAVCNSSNPDQLWRVSPDVNSTNRSEGGTLVHAASGLALSIVSCTGSRKPHTGAPLTLRPVGAVGSGCPGGLNQLWRAQANGTVTSALDGSCLDVNRHVNPVQSFFCTRTPGAPPGSPAPISEVWRVQSPGALSLLAFEGAAPGFTECLQARAATQEPWRAAPPLLSPGAEVWEKQLAGGDVALLLLNRGSAAWANLTVSFAAVPGLMNASAVVEVTDVWTGASSGTVAGSLSRSVQAHGVALLRLRRV